MNAELPIKAVEMVRRIRDAHAAQLAGATVEERVAFYRERGGQAQVELERLSKRRPSGQRKAA